MVHSRRVDRRLGPLVASALATLTLLGACERGGSGGGGPGPAPSDPLAGAPQALPELLEWAQTALRTAPDPVAPPADPQLPSPITPTLHLEDQLWRAQVTCEWKPPAGESAALASIGPFQSDQPNPHFRPRVDVENAGIAIEMRGFSAPCDKIGAIAIELLVPAGRHFDLAWSRAGRVRVPLPDNEKFWSLTIASDGFAEFSGTLDKLDLLVQTPPPGRPVQVRSLRLLPRERAFTRPVGVRRVTLSREGRTALYLHCPAEVRFSGVEIPAGARFHAGLGTVAGPGGVMRAESPPGDAESRPAATGATPTDDHTARIELIVSHGGRETVVLDRRVSAASGAWTDVSAALDQFAGQRVDVILRANATTTDAVALLSAPTIYTPMAEPPLVVLYLIDTLGATHMSLYGYERPTTPRLDALAAEGAWFSDAFANASRTIESVPNLLLSLPSERHGVDGPSATAPLQLVSLADALRAAGFATASFCTNVNAGPRQAMDQGFESFFDRIGYYWAGDGDRTVPIDDVLNWLSSRRDRPAFLYIHTAEPHAPYTPRPGYAGCFTTGYTGQIDGSYDPRRGFQQAREERDLRHVIGLYDEEIRYADARFGAFLEAVAAAGLRERLTIVVVADHGEEFLQHGAWEHGKNLFCEALRIPLIIAGPKVSARGRIAAPAQLMDVMPTILDLFELPRPYPLSGVSLAPLLGKTPTAEEVARHTAASMIVSSNYNYAGGGVIEWSVKEAGRWKLLLNSRPLPSQSGRLTSRFALFDLHADPGEQRNVIDEQPEVARRLIGRLIAFRRENPRYQVGATDQRSLDAEQLRELQNLGYVGGDAR